MKRIYLVYLSLITVAFIFAGCAKVKEDIPVIPSVSVHAEGIMQKSSPNFHGKLISNNNWDMKQCQSCHAANYSGGTTGSSCLTCHSQPTGPEACNTCHGDFRNPAVIYPPQDTKNNTDPSVRGVGAHRLHLNEALMTKGKLVDCSTCHNVPPAFNSPGHIDNSPHAELIFSGLAANKTNVPGTMNYTASQPTIEPNPQYDYEKLECSNTYCHGAFKNGNENNVVKWTDGANGAKCGSCHGDVLTGNPAPGGNHPPSPNCGGCHADVAESDGAGGFRIKDKTKHINGLLNVFGSEREY